MKKTVFMVMLLLCCAAHTVLFAADGAVIASSPTHAGYLFDHEKLVSPNGAYALVLQKDGNLTAQDVKCGSAPSCKVWNSASSREQGQYFMAIQPDGNLVVYKGFPPAGADRHIWSSKTAGAFDTYFLIMQDDGNVVIYRGTPANNRGAVWSSKTGKVAGH